MPEFQIKVRAREAFAYHKVEADSPEQAEQIFKDGEHGTHLWDEARDYDFDEMEVTEICED